MKKKSVKEEFCAACECRLLTDAEKYGPVCLSCYKKTRRRDPLMQAAIQRRLVTIVPAICPHDENCKFDRTMHFNVIVFNANLMPIKIEGPFPKRIAEAEAKEIQKKIDRRRGRGR